MTTAQQTATAAANGQAGPAAAATPPPAGPGAPPEGDCVPVSERLMGLFALGFAVAIGIIGLDLFTGGALARVFSGKGDDGGDSSTQ